MTEGSPRTHWRVGLIGAAVLIATLLLTLAAPRHDIDISSSEEFTFQPVTGDVDGNGCVDPTDRGLVVRALSSVDSFATTVDLDGDGKTTEKDLALVDQQMNFCDLRRINPGDVNLDGCVDQQDQAVVENLISNGSNSADSAPASQLLPDANGDGAVTSADRSIIKRNLGRCSAAYVRPTVEVGSHTRIAFPIAFRKPVVLVESATADARISIDGLDGTAVILSASGKDTAVARVAAFETGTWNILTANAGQLAFDAQTRELVDSNFVPLKLRTLIGPQPLLLGTAFNAQSQLSLYRADNYQAELQVAPPSTVSVLAVQNVLGNVGSKSAVISLTTLFEILGVGNEEYQHMFVGGLGDLSPEESASHQNSAVTDEFSLAAAMEMAMAEASPDPCDAEAACHAAGRGGAASNPLTPPGTSCTTWTGAPSCYCDQGAASCGLNMENSTFALHGDLTYSGKCGCICDPSDPSNDCRGLQFPHDLTCDCACWQYKDAPPSEEEWRAAKWRCEGAGKAITADNDTYDKFIEKNYRGYEWKWKVVWDLELEERTSAMCTALEQELCGGATPNLGLNMDTCRCGCSDPGITCTGGKVFDPRLCECGCSTAVIQACNAQKLRVLNKDCECVCSELSKKKCTSEQQFNPTTCECDPIPCKTKSCLAALQFNADSCECACSTAPTKCKNQATWCGSEECAPGTSNGEACRCACDPAALAATCAAKGPQWYPVRLSPTGEGVCDCLECLADNPERKRCETLGSYGHFDSASCSCKCIEVSRDPLVEDNGFNFKVWDKEKCAYTCLAPRHLAARADKCVCTGTNAPSCGIYTTQIQNCDCECDPNFVKACEATTWGGKRGKARPVTPTAGGLKRCECEIDSPVKGKPKIPVSVEIPSLPKVGISGQKAADKLAGKLVFSSPQLDASTLTQTIENLRILGDGSAAAAAPVTSRAVTSNSDGATLVYRATIGPKDGKSAPVDIEAKKGKFTLTLKRLKLRKGAYLVDFYVIVSVKGNDGTTNSETINLGQGKFKVKANGSIG